MRVYYSINTRNAGDNLTPLILRSILPQEDLEQVARGESGKLLAVGSILAFAKPGDVIWGTGAMYGDDFISAAPEINVLATRGPMTREIIVRSGGSAPSIFGDPGLLMPLIFTPEVKKRYKLGIVPHYVDYVNIGRNMGHDKAVCLLDVFQPVRCFIRKLLQCERIISSSLHGLVLAEAYGIPCEWREFSKNVYGDGFKFRDYLAGTGREVRSPCPFPAIENLPAIQERLLASILDFYCVNFRAPGA